MLLEVGQSVCVCVYVCVCTCVMLSMLVSHVQSLRGGEQGKNGSSRMSQSQPRRTIQRSLREGWLVLLKPVYARMKQEHIRCKEEREREPST